ncbi:MAG: hypothetical protein MR051_09135 [Lentisphaeria bacterium]|nr:hypothetical protein [Lentisphaeria bacterium]
MIAIGFSDFFALLLSAGMLYLAWLWFRESSRQKRNAWQVSNSRLFHCNNCHHHFVPRTPVSLCRCPRCNTVCIRRRSDLLIDSPRRGGEQ